MAGYENFYYRLSKDNHCAKCRKERGQKILDRTLERA